MDKRIIQAVAGSGKTTYILEQLSTEKRSLIITYTNDNYRNLESGIRAKFNGCVPPNITLLTYFTFLNSFCYKPYLGYKWRTRGFYYDQPPVWTSRKKQDGSVRAHYVSVGNLLFHNRAAKLLLKTDTGQKIVERINKYFDALFVDEVQDFAANDFNLLISLSNADVSMLFVGDVSQHTFDTSRDGSTRRSLHDNYDKYFSELETNGFKFDPDTLTKSYRCSPSICSFVSDNLGLNIQSHREDDTEVLFIDDQEKAIELFSDNSIVKLFYSEQAKYDCFSNNWSKSKGINHYQDVCVVLNKATYQLYKKSELIKLASKSKNGFYVACTRARGNLYLVPDDRYKLFKN